MKPCRKNRKPIAWLAVDALEARAARQLRAHLESCEGCRAYLSEISAVTRKLSDPELTPEIQATAAFHRKVHNALLARNAGFEWSNLLRPLRLTALNWRMALPLAGAAAVAVLILSGLLRDSAGPAPGSRHTHIISTSTTSSDLPPTLANYQMLASHSLEELDDLLTRQANRAPPPTSIYTASTLAATTGPD